MQNLILLCGRVIQLLQLYKLELPGVLPGFACLLTGHFRDLSEDVRCLFTKMLNQDDRRLLEESRLAVYIHLGCVAAVSKVSHRPTLAVGA